MKNASHRSHPPWRYGPMRTMTLLFFIFLDHTQRRTTVGRTPLDEWSARRKRPVPENTRHSQQTNIHATGGTRTHSLSSRAAADLRLRPRGHWDRCHHSLTERNITIFTFPNVRDQAEYEDILYRWILVSSYESDTIPESKIFRKETVWDITRREHSWFLCIVKSRRLRWAERATRIWDKMSTGKTVVRPGI